MDNYYISYNSQLHIIHVICSIFQSIISTVISQSFWHISKLGLIIVSSCTSLFILFIIRIDISVYFFQVHDIGPVATPSSDCSFGRRKFRRQRSIRQWWPAIQPSRDAWPMGYGLWQRLWQSLLQPTHRIVGWYEVHPSIFLSVAMRNIGRH